MKQVTFFSLMLTFVLASGIASATDYIRVGTSDIDLIFKVNGDGRLCQSYFGTKLTHDSDIGWLGDGQEAFAVYGQDDYFEPALKITHADGNVSLRMKYVSDETVAVDDNVSETTIVLEDEVYPVELRLVYTAYRAENVITCRTVVRHGEKKPVVMYNYASAMLRLKADSYWLTEFSGNWADETKMSEQPLKFGKKIIDSNLGTRANLFCSPFFTLSLDDRMSENHGDVLIGTLAWSGNFRFTFEVDENNCLRVISGINPFSSEYHLEKDREFVTPDFIFTLSGEGAGKASRSLHDWARKYRIKNGLGDRLTLLNNWEATFFDFNDEKLKSLIHDAAELGVDMFLLDDGWFGNSHPRNSGTQGLGDWQVNKLKLPDGLGGLVRTAEENGVVFGLWIEPEMVNPKSTLYEEHRDWALRFPNRDEKYFRNQLVLDLTNPEVQDFVINTIDTILEENPGVAYFKWDCNSPIGNQHSAYEKYQSHLWVDYVNGLYRVMSHVSEKYPDLPMMLCSGGGGRTDYGALQHFTEFWASDNTDPIERIFIQWGYSYVYPNKAVSAHVTNWNRSASIKFRTDVAMMGKLGFDILVNELSTDELAFCQKAVSDYKRLKPAILEGDFYRLHSPYGNQHAAAQSVSKDRRSSVVFAYDVYPRFGERFTPVRLDGLDPEAMYRITEINLMPGRNPSVRASGAVLSGEFLMSEGIELFSTDRLRSVVLELEAVE